MSKADCGPLWPWRIEQFGAASEHMETVTHVAVIIMGADEETIVADHLNMPNAERIMRAMELLEKAP